MPQHHHQLIVQQFTQQAIPFAQLPGHLDSLDLLLELTRPTSEDTVLDLACGPGLVSCAFARQAGQVIGVDLTPAMLETLRGYAWPGNVRELDNEIERAVALAYGDIITTGDLSEVLQQAPSAPGGRSLLKDSEKQLIEQALKESKGNKTQAAQRLGMSREGLRKKLKRLGME